MAGRRVRLAWEWDFDPDHLNDGAFSAASDPTTLQVALSLAAAVEQADRADPLSMEHLGMALACSVIRLLGAEPAVGTRSMTSEKLGTLQCFWTGDQPDHARS